MNRLIETTFRNRGYSADFLREIDNAEYGVLKDIDKLAVRLKEIHDDGLVMTIFPDFDMDGIASGTLGFAGFSELGFNVNLFIPNPKEGYGISADSVRDLLQQYPDTNVIITCDTGITAADAAKYCRSAGVELIVTDHHIQSQVIDASIIVDPMRADEVYEHPDICGAFVLYQVLQHYADLYCNSFTRDQIRRLRVFAGIGTISDTMPVLYANRQVVKDAIMICRLIYGDGTAASVSNITGSNIYRKAFWGLYDFLKVCEDYDIIKDENSIDEDFFGYYLAPIFNSPKRMDGDMSKAFGAFFANDSRKNADYLYNLNVERKEYVNRECNAMRSHDQPYAPYLYFTTAKAGVLGLLATKCLTPYAPVFVAVDEGENADGPRYHGSGRSPEWYPCLSRLGGVISIAGHEHAFGWSCNTEAELAHFIEVLKQDIQDVLPTVQTQEIVPDFIISTDWSKDTGIDIALFDEYLNEIDRYRPFGKGFPAPYVEFMFSNNDVVEWKQIGKAKEHLKISFSNGFDCLCWNQGHLIKQKDSFSHHIVTGSLGRSEFMGNISINFVGVLKEQ